MSKIVVVGANHAGTACINTMLDNYGAENEVVIFDQNSNISFLACGMALWIGQQISKPDGLFYADKETFEAAKLIMEQVNLKEEDRNVVLPARKRAENLKETVDKNEIVPVIALELEDGTIITGRNTETLDSSASVLVNAIKYLANISDDIHLISPVILEPIIKLKSETLSSKNVALNCEEVLIALSICAATNPMAQAAMDKLPLLTGGQAHSTIIIPTNDEQTFRKLGIDITCDAVYPSESLYY